MRLPIIFTKRLLTNPYAIGWGIVFVYFWIVMGALVESVNIPKSSAVYYTASWYGIEAMFANSAFAVSITFMISYQAGGLSYLTRFSRLTPKYYLFSLYVTMLTTTLVVSGIIGLGVISLFSYHFGELILPKNWGLFFLEPILAGLLFLPLSMVLVELTILTSRKLRNAISFIPLILTYLFGFSYLYLKLCNVVYYSPFVSIQAIGIQSFFTEDIPLNYTDYSGPTFNVGYAIASVIGWSIALSLIAMLLLRRLYYKSLEEERII